MSVRGKLVVRVIRSYLNVNPGKNIDAVKRIKALQSKPTRYKVPKGYTLEKWDAGGFPMEMCKPAGSSPENAVYIVHGGAFVGGLSDLYRRDYVKYSKAAGDAAVFNIDYRTAPEHLYPAAHEDVMKGWETILSRGFLPGNTLIVGDSAGGNLVLSTMLRLRDAGKPMPRAAVVMSPWADLAVTGKSYITNYQRDPMFGNKKTAASPELIEKFINSRIFVYGGKEDRKNPYLSPVFGEYHDFPPMHISVGSSELLYDESVEIYNKINAGGGKAVLHVGKDMFHTFPLHYHLVPEGKLAWDEIIQFIKERFAE